VRARRGALIREGIDLGLVRDDDPTLMAYGVVGVVSTYSHFQRTGRLGDARRDRRTSSEVRRSASRPTTRSRAVGTTVRPEFPLHASTLR
jgi:hypothetical protein